MNDAVGMRRGTARDEFTAEMAYLAKGFWVSEQGFGVPDHADSRLAARRVADRLRRKETEPVDDVVTERILVPPPMYNPDPEYTREELVAALRVPPEEADRIWNAFGFAQYETPDKIFSQADLDALSCSSAPNRACLCGHRSPPRGRSAR